MAAVVTQHRGRHGRSALATALTTALHFVVQLPVAEAVAQRCSGLPEITQDKQSLRARASAGSLVLRSALNCSACNGWQFKPQRNSSGRDSEESNFIVLPLSEEGREFRFFQTALHRFPGCTFLGSVFCSARATPAGRCLPSEPQPPALFNSLAPQFHLWSVPKKAASSCH